MINKSLREWELEKEPFKICSCIYLFSPKFYFIYLDIKWPNWSKVVQTHPNLSKLVWLLLSLNAPRFTKHFTFPHLYSESFPVIGHFCPKPFTILIALSRSCNQIVYKILIGKYYCRYKKIIA